MKRSYCRRLICIIFVLLGCQLEAKMSNSFFQQVLSQKEADILYQMTKDFHDVMEKFNVRYWIHGGTLLGSFRDGGLLPWDDDIDIAIDESYEKKVADLEETFCDYGYTLKKWYFGFKLFPKGGKVTEWGCNFPWIDIMVFVEREGLFVWREAAQAGDVEFKNGPHFSKEDLFPLKEYSFGPLLLKGPLNPVPYLDLVYPQWKEIAVLYNHLMPNKIQFLLSDIKFECLLPSVALKDRTS